MISSFKSHSLLSGREASTLIKDSLQIKTKADPEQMVLDENAGESGFWEVLAWERCEQASAISFQVKRFCSKSQQQKVAMNAGENFNTQTLSCTLQLCLAVLI